MCVCVAAAPVVLDALAVGGLTAVGGLALAVWRFGPAALVTVGYVLVKWFTGGQWRHNYTGRRLVTRPVRAVGQTGGTVLAVGAVLNWALTLTVVAVAAVLLFGSAVVVRRRRAGRRLLPPFPARRVKAVKVRHVAGPVAAVAAGRASTITLTAADTEPARVGPG